MNKLTPEQAGWSLMRIWMTAYEQAAADFHGVRAKSFCKIAYEYATEEWLKVLKEDYGIVATKANSIREAIESYIETGIRGSLFKDASLKIQRIIRRSSMYLRTRGTTRLRLCNIYKTCLI